MALLSIANLGLSFGDRRILDGINLTLAHGEHVGLVGRNGCGKSTLMKLIAGVTSLKPDEGQLQLARGSTVGYLTQDPDLDLSRTLREEAAAGFEKLRQLHEQLDDLTHRMSEAQGDELERLLKQYEAAEHEMHAAGGYTVDHEIDATLHGVGLGDETFDVTVGDLSGGQKGRLALAKLLLSKPDLLLLDEPTNHLDIAGRQWLEEYLAQYNGAVMVVSHDRWLLDRVVTKINEIERGRMVEYPGNYEQFVEIRKQRQITQQRAYDKHNDQVKREQQFIDRYRAGQRAKQAKGREKRLERFKETEAVERPIEMDAMALRFSPRTRCGDMVLGAEHLSKAYDDKVLFSDVTVSVKRGQRIGVIGPNGAGKSTLINCMLEEMGADAGAVRMGTGVDVGHFTQTHEHLDLSRTVVQYLQTKVDGNLEQTARDLAGAFLFSGLDQDKPLSVLSGGERARAVLAGLMTCGHNLLVLDEPSNHLDIPSAERLEEALRHFAAPESGTYSTAANARPTGGGTLVLITHDRYLLDHVVDELLVLDGQGQVKHFLGNYSDYLRAETEAHRAEQARLAEAANAAKQSSKSPTKKPNRKAAETRASTNAGSALSKLNQETLEQRIMELETALNKVDQQLGDPSVYSDGEKVRQLQDRRGELQEELSPLELEWMARAENSS